MINLTNIITLILLSCISCAPVIHMQENHYHYQEHDGLIKAIDKDSLSFSNIDLARNELDPYQIGYSNGAMTAKNVPVNGYGASGWIIGMTAVVAGISAPALLASDTYGPFNAPIAVISVAGCLSASIGSIYLIRRIKNIYVPEIIVNDTLYREGFIEGYRVTLKSRRLKEALKGTGMSVGCSCIGIASIYALVYEKLLFPFLW